MAKLWNAIFMFPDVVFLLENNQIKRNPSLNYSLDSKERVSESLARLLLELGGST